MTSEYLNYEKIPGIKKFEQIQTSYNCAIPEREINGQPLLGSANGEFFKVQYFLRCFVKIKSIFEIGMGKCY